MFISAELLLLPSFTERVDGKMEKVNMLSPGICYSIIANVINSPRFGSPVHVTGHVGQDVKWAILRSRILKIPNLEKIH